MMGVDQRSVSSIELGVVDGSIQTKARVADFLGVSLQDVLRWTGDLN
jgi:DNA-binding XRE family transcriptional regulator